MSVSAALSTADRRSDSEPPDTAPRRAAAPTICFGVQAAAEPDVMPRVLEFFAQRNLVPTQWHSAVSEAERGELQIDIQVARLDPGIGDRIARCLRRLVNVERVLVSVKGEAGPWSGPGVRC